MVVLSRVLIVDLTYVVHFQIMSSLTSSSEIVQSKELNLSQSSGRFHQTRMQDKDQKPPLVKKVINRSSGYDINKLFEGIDLRTSKSLDLSDRRNSGLPWKNASKKPMRIGGSHSPGIGFSEPVSLKQALRGLCISQAAEMAATKRLSKPPGSPSVSDGGKVSSFHRSVLVEAGDSGVPLPEISLVPEESTSCSSSKFPRYIVEPKSKSANHSAQSSPRFLFKSALKDIESAWKQTEVLPPKIQSSLSQEERHISFPSPLSCEPRIRSGSYSTHSSPRLHHSAHSSPRILDKASTTSVESTLEGNETLPALTQIEIQPETLQAQKENHFSSSSAPSQPKTSEAWEEKHVSVPPLPPRCADKHVTVSNKGTKNPRKSIGTPVRVGTKATPKLRRKRRSQTLQSSSAMKSNMGSKSMKSTSRAGKSAKSTSRKKEKDDSVLAAGKSNSSDDVSGVEGSTMQSVCQRCKCHLTDAKMESISNGPRHIPTSIPPVSPFSRSYGASKRGFISTGCDSAITPPEKFNKMSKSREHLEFSHSSKSSIGDYSSSTTFSEESNLSGPSSGNKPHMSKDFRWEAINNVRKQHGFLGLGHFTLLKKLGSGDIGTVYLAELIGINCLFAIKVMDNDFLARRRKMTRAQTEREILRMLDHPFLPTLYSQFTSDNLSCLVMEFCPGGDLHVLRQKQPGGYFPEQAARFYVAEVLLALEYLHMLGIVYRDLKPENIMVREDGHIMLTDFDLSLRCSINPTLLKSPVAVEPPRISGPCAGSNCIDPFCAGPSCKVSCFSPRVLPTTARARKLKAELAAESRLLPQLVAEPTQARSNSFVGTHEYLAPEIIKGDGHGSAVDWWTLGIFLYELLYGKTPFRGANNEETLANVVLQSLRFPDSPIVSVQARDLIRRLLVKEPEHRFGTETGAAEIKRHPFFDGLKWALIRCAIPPEVPEFSDVGISKMGHLDNGKRFLEYGPTGEHLEFELF